MQSIKTKLKKASTTPSGKKTWLIILTSLLLLIFGGIWYWNTHKRQIIRNKIEKAVIEKSEGLYTIRYDSLELDELAGWLYITNMRLKHDTAMYSKAATSGNTPFLLVDILIPEIMISGIKTPRALIEKEIVGRKVEIRNPVIGIEYTNEGKDAARNIPTQEIYKQLLGNLGLIKLDTVLISGAQITTSSRKGGKSLVAMQDMNVLLMDIKIDNASSADTSRIFFANRFTTDTRKITWTSPDKLYNYTAENISLNSDSKKLLISKFSVDPVLGEEAFVKALPAQDDRYDFSFSNIRLESINLENIMEEKLVAGSMTVPSASFKVYRDLAIPRDKKNRVGHYPHQVMDDIPFLFAIKKIFFTDAFIEYKERNHITRQSGKVQFYDVNASFNNFTNDKKVIAANNLMTANINSSFLNKTALRTDWTFYLLHPKGRFDVKGSVGPIQAAQLNPLTEPMGPASIKEGNISGVEFDLKGDDYGMDGKVEMRYEDLKVAILEKDKGATETDKKFLTSLLANLVIKNSNPKSSEEVRIAQVHLDRNTNRSIFYLCWKTLFKGVKETVGIKNN